VQRESSEDESVDLEQSHKFQNDHQFEVIYRKRINTQRYRFDQNDGQVEEEQITQIVGHNLLRLPDQHPLRDVPCHDLHKDIQI